MLNLGFDSTISGTIADKDGEGTGFDSVQVNTQGNQYDSSRINLDTAAGTLTLTATKGSNATANTLKNGLQVGLDATKTFTISTRISSSLTNLKEAVQQGGLYFGSDQDNYAKLVVVQTGSGGLNLQFYKEENGVGSTVSIVKNLTWSSINTLDLYLTGDPVTKTITAAYRTNSNTAAPTTFTQSFKPSSQSTSSFFGNATNTDAGILAFTRDAADVPITFNYFGIAQDIKINFQTSSASVPTGYVKDSGEGYNATRGYGWVKSGTHTPLDYSLYARERNRSGVDQRLDTLLHMQYAGAAAAAWEYAVPNGTYSVTVSVGDQPKAGGVYDSSNTIRVENKTLIDHFQATAKEEYHLATATVNVTDGRLTVDAVGGSNTKINYLEITNITPGRHPYVTDSSFSPDATGLAYRDTAINVDVKLPTVGKGVATPLNTTNVQLYRTEDGYVIPGEVNTSGAGDAIVYQPSQLLDANTNYTFKVTNAVRDEAGATFIPYSTTFNTGTQSAVDNSSAQFTKSLVYGNVDQGGPPISSLVISPDGTKLYAAGLDGYLRRWNINSNGTLSGLQSFKVGGAIVGLTFDPNNSNVLWLSDNDPLYPRPADDFTGKVLKLTLKSGSSFDANIQNYVVGLPRSGKDHLTNSLTFGSDGMLYLSQGSTSAMGAPDAGWFNRPERLLSASILQIDPTKTTVTNVQTENYTTTKGKKTTGNYDPYSSNAVVKIYAAGIRNSYDLVWHSNGYLYAPTNGSAAGGNTPDDPNISGNQALTSASIENDYLYKIETHNVDDRNATPYYGHPNPKQGYYIMDGGNPTSGVDPAEVVANNGYTGYSVGTKPDSDYQGYAYDFGRNRSPDGAIEYKSNTFGGILKNKLLVAEYSGGDDILALGPDSNGNVSSGKVTKVFSGLDNPLDLTEDTRNGNLYVAELKENGSVYSGQISLLKA